MKHKKTFVFFILAFILAVFATVRTALVLKSALMTTINVMCLFVIACDIYIAWQLEKEG